MGAFFIAMAKEIERKFLVTHPPDLGCYGRAKIAQGYLATGALGAEVRLRQKADQFFQTVKLGEGVQRTEVEIALSREQFETLWPLTEGMRVEKVRYEIPLGALTIELDVYEGGELVVAEVEFETISESQSFVPPEWFGRDVTEDARYRNANLALMGKPR